MPLPPSYPETSPHRAREGSGDTLFFLWITGQELLDHRKKRMPGVESWARFAGSRRVRPQWRAIRES
jgi:hypothetical protein